MRKQIQAKTQEPGLSAPELYQTLQKDWGLKLKAVKRHLSAVAAAPPEEEFEDLTLKELGRFRAEGGGRKTQRPEALLATKLELELEESRGHQLDTKDLLHSFTEALQEELHKLR